jgi:hypothetical protein
MYTWIRTLRSHKVRLTHLYAILLLLAACHPGVSYPPGGYLYPEQVTGKDTQFYRYPLRKIETRRDSMEDALFYEDFQNIGEPNLSLRPMPTDIFRFIYGDPSGPAIYIIKLTPAEIIVRIGNPTKEYQQLPDTGRLDTLERRLIDILTWGYPLDQKTPKYHAKRQHYLDSMGHLYPRLYDPEYYHFLRNKLFDYSKPWYTFIEKRIKITPSGFEHLVQAINASGYWHLPYKEVPCENCAMDGGGFSLEANTSSQYNFVSSGGPDTSLFNKACQELVRHAGLEKKIQLVWEDRSTQPDTAKHSVIVEDVQLEDVKEPKKNRHHPLKTPHPN